MSLIKTYYTDSKSIQRYLAAFRLDEKTNLVYDDEKECYFAELITVIKFSLLAMVALPFSLVQIVRVVSLLILNEKLYAYRAFIAILGYPIVGFGCLLGATLSLMSRFILGRSYLHVYFRRCYAWFEAYVHGVDLSQSSDKIAPFKKRIKGEPSQIHWYLAPCLQPICHQTQIESHIDFIHGRFHCYTLRKHYSIKKSTYEPPEITFYGDRIPLMPHFTYELEVDYNCYHIYTIVGKYAGFSWTNTYRANGCYSFGQIECITPCFPTVSMLFHTCNIAGFLQCIVPDALQGKKGFA